MMDGCMRENIGGEDEYGLVMNERKKLVRVPRSRWV